MRIGDDGFTLVEVLVALALFSLIGVAGFSLLNAVVGVQSRTEGRLDRLADMQRTMHVLVLDFQQVAIPPVLFEAGTASFRRYTNAGVGQTVAVRYDLMGQDLRRTLSFGGNSNQEQILLSGVEALRWSFFDTTNGWTETWPPAGANPDLLPQAIAAELTLRNDNNDLAGVLRRVVRLPGQPDL